MKTFSTYSKKFEKQAKNAKLNTKHLYNAIKNFAEAICHMRNSKCKRKRPRTNKGL